METPEFSYREIAPTIGLEPYILSFWEFSVGTELDGSINFEIFPDGCSSLFYYRNTARNINVIGITGMNLETVKRPVFAGDTFWGMRISPASCSTLLQTDPAALVRFSGLMSENDFPHLSGGLLSGFSSAAQFQDFISICENRIGCLIDAGCSYDEKVAEATRAISDAIGEIRVDQLAKTLNLSTRQFQRRFKASSGLTPKQYLRTRRIRAAAVDLVENRKQNWASRAADLGFADQSHLTHEFLSVTNRSPKSFAENLRDVAHGDLIK